MEPENNTPDTLPQVGGDGAVKDVVQTPEGGATSAASPAGAETQDALSLKEINEYLGKNFKDKATALEALKNTQSFVGKRESDIEKELRAQGYLRREDLENELFFRDNPAHAKNKDILEAIASSKGISLKEAVAHESYTRLYEGASKYEENQNMKSVLEPSPRLKAAIDRTKNVAELKQAGRNSDAVGEAAKAVIEAFDL